MYEGVKEVKGDSPEGIGAKRRPLTSEGRQPLSLKKVVLKEGMQQSQGTGYAASSIGGISPLTSQRQHRNRVQEDWHGQPMADTKGTALCLHFPDWGCSPC
jgi:hypothetical protein